MLVLSRKPGEVICVGDGIRITIVDIDRGKVRIGIEAPQELAVDRLEVFESKKKSRAEKVAPVLSL